MLLSLASIRVCLLSGPGARLGARREACEAVLQTWNSWLHFMPARPSVGELRRIKNNIDIESKSPQASHTAIIVNLQCSKIVSRIQWLST
jgi:hypothetical protein